MKNNDNQTLLERQQQIDAERRAQAILRQQHESRDRDTARRMAQVFAATSSPSLKDILWMGDAS